MVGLDTAAEWKRRLEQDGVAPDDALVDGCISLFGASSAYVLGYESGSSCTVISQEGGLIGNV